MIKLVAILGAFLASLIGTFLAIRFERRASSKAAKTAGDALVKQAEALGTERVKNAKEQATERLRTAEEIANEEARSIAAASRLRDYLNDRRLGR